MGVQFNPKTGSRSIEWTDETRNVIGGCMHECKWQMPDGTIAECYAKTVAEKTVVKSAYPQGFESHYFRPDQLKALSSGAEPRLIFCDSMSDLFAANVPEDQVRQILNQMRKAPHHAYQCLTKAAPQILKYIDDLPPNLWVGVSSPPDWMFGRRLTIKQQESTLLRSMHVVQQVKERTGNLVWMSAEPLSWDLTNVMDCSHPFDWVVIGAASNGRATFQPNPLHVGLSLIVLDHNQTPVFFKGNLRDTFQCEQLRDDENLGRWREDFPRKYRDGSLIPAVERRQLLCADHGWTASIMPIPKVSE